MSVDITIGAKNSPFRAGLNECRNHAQKFSGDLRKMFASSLGSVGTALSLGGITAAFGKIVNQASEIKRLSAQFGVNTQALQKVGNGLAKGDLEAVAPLLNKLVISQERAREGNKKLAASFTTLGISQKELDSLSPDELLYRIADGTKNAGDRGAAYNAVVSVMGKNAGAFFAKLEQGSEVLKKNGDAMGVYSDRAVSTFANLGKQVNNLKSQALPVLAEIGAAIVRVVSKSWSIRGAILGAGKVALFGGGRKGVNEYMDKWLEEYKKKYGAEAGEPGKHLTGERAKGFSGDGDELGVVGSDSSASRITALQEKKAAITAESYEKSLSAERAITALKERQASLTQEASDARKDGDEETALKKEIEAAEAGKKSIEERSRLSHELASTQERTAALERESLTGAAKINALIKDRTRLLREANLDQLAGDPSGAARKRLEAAERGREIDKEKKAVRAEALKAVTGGAENATKQAELAVQEENEIARNKKEARERHIARLPEAEQKRIRNAEKVEMDAEKIGVSAQMMAATDPDEKRKLRVRMSELDVASEEKRDQIDALDKKDRPKSHPRAAVSDSLQRVGGGGGIGPAMDPMLRRADRTNELLQKLVDGQQRDGTVPSRSRAEY